VLVGDQAQGIGLGNALMQKMIGYCKQQGTMEMMGTVLAENRPMLKLGEKLGFEKIKTQDAEIVEIILPMNEPKHEWQKARLSKLHNKIK